MKKLVCKCGKKRKITLPPLKADEFFSLTWSCPCGNWYRTHAKGKRIDTARLFLRGGMLD